MPKYRIIVEFEATDDPEARVIARESYDTADPDEITDVKLQRIVPGKSPVGLKF